MPAGGTFKTLLANPAPPDRTAITYTKVSNPMASLAALDPQSDAANPHWTRLTDSAALDAIPGEDGWPIDPKHPTYKHSGG